MAEKEYIERDELESRIKKYVKCRDADRETLEWAKDECIDKCSHGSVCAYRHQYDDHIVTCSHWKPVAEERKLTHQKIVSELDGADVFLRGRATSKTASLNEYDIEVLLGIANVCDEAADFIQRQKAEIESLKEAYAIYEETTGLKWARAEAIKEFAERLKKEIRDAYFVYEADSQCEYIHNLVKEMVGENNGN